MRDCEFYQRSFVSNSFRVRAARIRIQNDLFRIWLWIRIRQKFRIRIRQKVSGPTGSGSSTLVVRKNGRSISVVGQDSRNAEDKRRPQQQHEGSWREADLSGQEHHRWNHRPYQAQAGKPVSFTFLMGPPVLACAVHLYTVWYRYWIQTNQTKVYWRQQCCGSASPWCGSGSGSCFSFWCGIRADPAFQFDADPDPVPTTHFFPDLDPPMLQNGPLRLSPFHFDANPDPDPAFHFDPDPNPAFYFDPDPNPAFHFIRIRILLFTSMRIRIQLLKMLQCGSGSAALHNL